MHDIVALPCFADNYIWCLRRPEGVWVVDPGADDVVRAALTSWRLPLAGILVTHRHDDHVGGIPALRAAWPDAPVVGPRAATAEITRPTDGVATLSLPGLGEVRILPAAAHTREHVVYHLPDVHVLLCGDALFSAGCGRLFDGTPADLLDVLQRLSALPDATLIYPAHEYTSTNLAFAAAAEPGNAEIARRTREVDALRAAGQPSLPVPLSAERLCNPFLRLRSPVLREQVGRWLGRPVTDDLDCLTGLRAWRNVFRA